MAPVPEECLVMVTQQNQHQQMVMMPELQQTTPTDSTTTPVVIVVTGGDAPVESQEQEQQQQQEEEDQQQQQPPQRRLNAVAQDSNPAEMIMMMNNKLERQDSCDSVGSLDEEGIQEDAAPDGLDSGSETQHHDSSSDLEPRSERSSSVVSDGSEEGGRDSGIEAEREPDMVIPEIDLMSRIVAQVEFYFSDTNVAKDKFLLKHIRRNKEGYVSLKLVSSFKKVKQLTKDWRVVAFSLNKNSTKIQINDVGTKIRRIDPLPDLEEVPVTCAVLALSLPVEKPNIQSVSQLFSSCGEIALIRVIRAGSTIPQDLKSLAAKHPSLSDSHCAWIEFETPEAAKAAIELPNEDGMQIVPILPEAQKKPEKQPTQQQKGSQPNSRKNSVTNNQNKGQGSRKNSIANLKNRKDSTSGSGSDGENGYQRLPRRKCVSLPQTQSPNLREISAVVEARRNRPKSKSCTEFPSGSHPTSWVQRHLLAAAAASAASAASPAGGRPPLARPTRVSQGSLPLPDGVVRFPKGPDGSRGFNSDSRRLVTVSESS